VEEATSADREKESHSPDSSSLHADREKDSHPPRYTQPSLARSLSSSLHPALTRPFALFLSLLLFLFFSSSLSLSNLIPSILRAFFDQNQSNLLQEVEDSPIYKWVSFRTNFVGSFRRILV
jgi:hypothetical protein